jgi:hypothetical protein
MRISEFCDRSGIRRSELSEALDISTQRLNYVNNNGGNLTVEGDVITLYTKTGLTRRCYWSDLPGRERFYVTA